MRDGAMRQNNSEKASLHYRLTAAYSIPTLVHMHTRTKHLRTDDLLKNTVVSFCSKRGKQTRLAFGPRGMGASVPHSIQRVLDVVNVPCECDDCDHPNTWVVWLGSRLCRWWRGSGWELLVRVCVWA